VADALPFARKAVERERSAPNFFLLADACRRNGDLAGARSAIAQAVELNPKEPSYRKSQDEIREKR
jgi:Flp pilus assembly protein TadD